MRPYRLTLGMKIGFLLGWGFFALAFLLAAAEATVGRGSFITSTNDLLVALIPGKWIAFKLRYDSAVMHFLVQTVLQLPGWLLASLPAGFLLWSCRPHREEVDPELYDSLLTFDRLAEMAEEEQAQDDDPTFTEFHPEDYNDAENPSELKSAKEYMAEWHPESAEDEEPEQRALGPDERMQEARDHLSIPFDKLS